MAGVPGADTVQCPDDVPEGPDQAVTASDNCGSATVSFSDNTDGINVDGYGTIIRTYIATDASGRTSSGTQTITVAGDNVCDMDDICATETPCQAGECVDTGLLDGTHTYTCNFGISMEVSGPYHVQLLHVLAMITHL